ncbi:arginase family protein [Actinomadura macrotermitis]|uniref:Formimidoylglutamase n=1 Tax=Actinomadura macrotermitis TaxID=2585200 RepID=A0A7K0BZP3_9ACTN|nr:arginase family protein [Actinomadura macrotermitis]MQY06332.1 Formimidoylglutamase [Actinomadura macrotermitis]
MPVVLQVPQWQGSSSPDARRLREGAERLAALIPDARYARPDVSDSPGTPDAGVRAADVLAANLRAVRAALAESGARVTVGGDCGVELAPVEAALQRHGDRLAVVWFDAHGDLNTPDSSPSGAFHGMVLRTLLGEGPAALAPARTLAPHQVVLAGVRALDPGESAYVERAGIRHLGAAGLAELPDAIDAGAVYVHIDLDVMDPGAFASVGFPEPGGVAPAALAAAVNALAARFEIAGLGVTEYQPARPQDQEVLATLVASLDLW